MAQVVVFEAADQIGGQLAIAAAAPNRSGWAPLLDFYERGLRREGVELRLGTPAPALDDFDAVVLATGAEEIVPAGALASSAVIASGPQAMSGAAHVIVVDDGFGWWPAINVVELALAARAGRVTLITPGTAFAGGIPAESRVQLVQRLAGAGALEVIPLASATEITAAGVTLVDSVSRQSRLLDGDRVVVAGERRPCATPKCAAPMVLAIGDAIVPRRAAHAIAEGRAAASRIAAAVRLPQLS